MKIVVATGNSGKIREIKEILSDIDTQIYSMKELGINSEPEENGKTFEENALIKARTLHGLLKEDALVLADDSGLVIDYLNGEPGIYSARYMGEDTAYTIKCQNILDRLSGVPKEKRSARFISSIALIYPDGREETVTASMEGYIAKEAKGSGGFGYDPIFYVEEFKKNVAELSDDEKNSISHRGKALRLMRDKIMEGIR